ADRTAFVTDAMAAAGLGDGDYTLGGRRVRVADGTARLADTGAIAAARSLWPMLSVGQCVTWAFRWPRRYAQPARFPLPPCASLTWGLSCRDATPTSSCWSRMGRSTPSTTGAAPSPEFRPAGASAEPVPLRSPAVLRPVRRTGSGGLGEGGGACQRALAYGRCPRGLPRSRPCRLCPGSAPATDMLRHPTACHHYVA